MTQNTTNIYQLDALIAERQKWRDQGLKAGFTCGSFDLLHAGHVQYLTAARQLCDRLIVAVNSDDSVRSYKNPLRPIVAEQHRLALIATLRCVDAAILMHETRPATLIEDLRPDIYIKGGDYKISTLKSAPLVESYGGTCAVIPVEHDISTSTIIRRIEELSLYSGVEPPAKPLHGPLVLLDRDGTLIDNKHFLRNPGDVRLLEGVGPGLKRLQDAGFLLAIITNQQGIGLGYFDYDTFVAVNSAMLKQLSQFAVRIARFYFCPHTTAEQCTCRKPAPGMVERALRDFNCNPQDCFVVGDSTAVVQAATAAGVP
jgi:D-glycero-beta-D-manno-heptose 1-phosphate adenylyltransferase